MSVYKQLAEQMLACMDAHRHMPPEPVSGSVRGEMAVLRLLGQENAGLSPGEIAQRLSMKTSRIAAVLKSLEKKNMIVRRADSLDRRRALVRLTEKGHAYHAARRQEAMTHMIALLENLGEKDAGEFVRLVGRVISFHPAPPPIPIDIAQEEEDLHA